MESKISMFKKDHTKTQELELKYIELAKVKLCLNNNTPSGLLPSAVDRIVQDDIYSDQLYHPIAICNTLIILLLAYHQNKLAMIVDAYLDSVSSYDPNSLQVFIKTFEKRNILYTAMALDHTLVVDIFDTVVSILKHRAQNRDIKRIKGLTNLPSRIQGQAIVNSWPEHFAGHHRSAARSIFIKERSENHWKT